MSIINGVEFHGWNFHILEYTGSYESYTPKFQSLFSPTKLLKRRFPTVSYTLVSAGAKSAHFGLCEDTARDWEVV